MHQDVHSTAARDFARALFGTDECHSCSSDPHIARQQRRRSTVPHALCSHQFVLLQEHTLAVVCRNDERELWRSFMEDFNTCTLPSRKYYDLAAHARKLAARAAAAGAPAADRIVDDERLRRAELMEEHRRQQVRTLAAR